MKKVFIDRNYDGQYSWRIKYGFWPCFKYIVPEKFISYHHISIRVWFKTAEEAERQYVRHVWREAKQIVRKRKAISYQIPPFKHVGENK